MIRTLFAVGLSLCLSLPGAAVIGANQPAPSVPLVVLYDMTMPPVAVDVRSDPRLKLVLNVVAQSLTHNDTVRIGLVAGHIAWSRTFGADERTILYSEVVNKASVPVDDRLRWPPLCDGLYDAVTAIAHDDGRRAVVVITTGHSGGNVHSFEELVAHAREAHVSLSAVHAEWPGNGRGSR